MHNLDKLHPHRFLDSLRKLFASQEELKNLMNGTKNPTDPFMQENS